MTAATRTSAATASKTFTTASMGEVADAPPRSGSSRGPERQATVTSTAGGVAEGA